MHLLHFGAGQGSSGTSQNESSTTNRALVYRRGSSIYPGLPSPAKDNGLGGVALPLCSRSKHDHIQPQLGATPCNSRWCAKQVLLPWTRAETSNIQHPTSNIQQGFLSGWSNWWMFPRCVASIVYADKTYSAWCGRARHSPRHARPSYPYGGTRKAERYWVSVALPQQVAGVLPATYLWTLSLGTHAPQSATTTFGRLMGPLSAGHGQVRPATFDQHTESGCIAPYLTWLVPVRWGRLHPRGAALLQEIKGQLGSGLLLVRRPLAFILAVGVWRIFLVVVRQRARSWRERVCFASGLAWLCRAAARLGPGSHRKKSLKVRCLLPGSRHAHLTNRTAVRTRQQAMVFTMLPAEQPSQKQQQL